ncbi:MAG TPA: molybdopterin molybdenumtransferase MoeA [Chromatiales bacterium]|nr:molybdopterin molybdenumtransferase MoeA [Chromatiales bacterium]
MTAEPSSTAETCCSDDYDPNSLPADEARRRILETVAPVTGREHLPIRTALGRVLAEPVTARIDVPGHDNSAMDGYALNSRELAGGGTVTLQVVGTSWAGKPYAGNIGPGQCVRIFTGAVMPPEADTVVIQEQVRRDGEAVHFDAAGQRPGQNVRRAGEDIRAGQRVLAPGRRLTPADLGLLASVGVAEVTVHRRPRVAFFSTGDELRGVVEPLAPGQIYDSNRYTLYGMLTRLGVDLLDMGVVPDRPEAIRAAFAEAAEAADVVMTSGGVSVGEADYVKETLDALGEVRFWKVAIKPGRPLAFGRVGGAWFFGLPGNPVSVMVTFYLFAQPALRRMMGETPTEPLHIRVPCTTALKKRPGRMEFQRGVLERDPQGRWSVRKTGPQGSGILSSMSEANCLIVLPLESAGVEPGAEVEVIPFCELT